jgi:hypothetical protein
MSKNKPYTLRKLDGEDLWPVLNIAAKALPDDLAAAFMDLVMGDKTIDEVGGTVAVRMVKAIIQNLETVKEEVYAFLSDASGLSRDEIIGLGLLGVPRMIWDIYNAEKDFFEGQA